MFENTMLNELERRGFVYQCTDYSGLANVIQKTPPVFYVGFDPTASSLHVGHLLWIRLVNQLQKLGFKPIVVAGGATGKIGDPSGKDAMRSMLSDETIERNIKSIRNILSNLIHFEQDLHNGAVLLNNDCWTRDVKYIDFLRDFGAHFSVNKMLTMDSVKDRLTRANHLSLLEFNYMCLQAYDFYYLCKEYDCILQIGGSDQWSNITHGINLIRRKLNRQAYGLSIPLLTTSEGTKMGKTTRGAVWLDANLTSPFDFWQYWRNVNDVDVIKLMKLFCDISLEEIESYSSAINTKEINDAKILLADSITEFVHGPDVLKGIKNKSYNMFYGDRDKLDITKVLKSTLLSDFIANHDKPCSKSMAKTLISQNAVKVNNEVINDVWYKIEQDCVISVGKKKVYNVKID